MYNILFTGEPFEEVASGKECLECLCSVYTHLEISKLDSWILESLVGKSETDRAQKIMVHSLAGQHIQGVMAEAL